VTSTLDVSGLAEDPIEPNCTEPTEPPSITPTPTTEEITTITPTTTAPPSKKINSGEFLQLFVHMQQ